MNNKENCAVHKTSIGGQAVLEGVMMRGPHELATAVRKSDGEIIIDKKPVKVSSNSVLQKTPVIRGVVNFISSMVVGVKCLMFSAEFYDVEGEEGYEPSKFEKWLDDKFGDKIKDIAIYFAVVVSLIMGIGLFMLLPTVLVGFLSDVMDNTILLNLAEGGVRMLIFLGYLALVSRMKDIQRVFEYHGAEHKTIAAYEHGEELTPENAAKYSRLHPRCGTSFLLVVMLLSILVFSVASSGLLAIIPVLETIRGNFLYRLIMIVFKLMLLPLVVGISYEINRWVGRHDNWFTRILTAPGMWMQNFTTNEPDEDMIRTGIAALEAVLPEETGEDRW